MTRRVLILCLAAGVLPLACGGDAAGPEPAHCLVEPIAIDFGSTLPPIEPGAFITFNRDVTVSNEILVVSGGDYRNLQGRVEIHPSTPAVIPPEVFLTPSGADPSFDIPAGESATLTFAARIRADTSPGTHRGSITFSGLCDSVRYVVRVSARPESPPSFVGEWGVKGDGVSQILSPVMLALDDEGLLYVSDPDTRRVQVYRTDGTWVRTAVSGVVNPRGVVVDGAPGAVTVPPPTNTIHPDALVYVADASTRTVKVLDPDGALIKSIGNSKEGRPFGTPWGCLLTPAHDLLVLDSANSWVATVDIRTVATQSNLGHWGVQGSAEGQMLNPIDFAWDPAGALFILDAGTVLVNRFTPDGTWLGRWGGAGSDPGHFVAPLGLAVDADGNVFVADSNNGRIQKLTPDGEFLTAWGEKGSGEGQFIWPVDVEVGPEGRIYALDRSRAKVLVFSY